jgi:FKBP-type peptidyl-prolyl cis-trans isomerase SlyD
LFVLKGTVNTLSDSKQTQLIADDLVVSMDYTLTVDGEVMDSSDEGPIVFLQGYGNVIPGLERALYGMAVGESKDITVSAKDAYGDFDPANIVDVPRKEFPPEIPLEKGTELQVKNNDGEVLHATISEITKQFVKLDFNHPLAGKELFFHVSIMDLREATAEELEHGHAHDGDDEFDEEDLDFEEEDLEFLDEEDEEDGEEEDEEEEDSAKDTK